VQQRTKCCGVPCPPFGERMLASILGQGDLMYPPPMGSSDPEHPHLGTARGLIGKVYAGGGELVFREVAFGNVGAGGSLGFRGVRVYRSIAD